MWDPKLLCAKDIDEFRNIQRNIQEEQAKKLDEEIEIIDKTILKMTVEAQKEEDVKTFDFERWQNMPANIIQPSYTCATKTGGKKIRKMQKGGVQMTKGQIFLALVATIATTILLSRRFLELDRAPCFVWYESYARFFRTEAQNMNCKVVKGINEKISRKLMALLNSENIPAFITAAGSIAVLYEKIIKVIVKSKDFINNLVILIDKRLSQNDADAVVANNVVAEEDNNVEEEEEEVVDQEEDQVNNIATILFEISKIHDLLKDVDVHEGGGGKPKKKPVVAPVPKKKPVAPQKEPAAAPKKVPVPKKEPTTAPKKEPIPKKKPAAPKKDPAVPKKKAPLNPKLKPCK